jgi:hypothetical protein
MMHKFNLLLFLAVIGLVMLACGQGTGGAVVSTPGGDQPPSEPTEVPLGSSRTSPAPTGSVVLADAIEFEVTGYTRPATSIVADAHPWNRKVESSEEYIFVHLTISCTKPAEEKCVLFLVNLKLVGSSGVERDVIWGIANVDNIIEQTDLYGGSSISKLVPYIINQDETDLILVYQPPFGDKFYLSIGE